MAVQALPILAVAGAAIVFSGGKKKRKKSKSGQKCNSSDAPPKGFICEDGFLREEAIDESDLEDMSKEDVGDFELEEEEIGIMDGEEVGDEYEEEDPASEPDMEKTCEEFMEAVHVVTDSVDEIPINAIAVEESVLPAMRSTAEGIIHSLGGPLDEESAGPVLVVEGLRALIPVCKWTYDPQNGFTYDDGKEITSDVARDVLFGLIKISLSVIEEINAADSHIGNMPV